MRFHSLQVDKHNNYVYKKNHLLLGLFQSPRRMLQILITQRPTHIRKEIEKVVMVEKLEPSLNDIHNSIH